MITIVYVSEKNPKNFLFRFVSANQVKVNLFNLQKRGHRIINVIEKRDSITLFDDLEKTSIILANHLVKPFDRDSYTESIILSAKYLVNQGITNAMYYTQYSSGSCCWVLDNGESYIVTNAMQQTIKKGE